MLNNDLSYNPTKCLFSTLENPVYIRRYVVPTLVVNFLSRRNQNKKPNSRASIIYSATKSSTFSKITTTLLWF